jgi:hypothetical protein
MPIQEDAQNLYAAAEELPVGPAESAQPIVDSLMALTQSVYHQLGDAPGRIDHALGATHPAAPELAGFAAQLKDRAEEIANRVVQLDTDLGNFVQHLHMLFERLQTEAQSHLQGS